MKNPTKKPDCFAWICRGIGALMLALLFAAPLPAAETQVFTAVGEGLKGTLSFSASPLRTMTRVPFALEVRDGQGAVLEGCTVSCDLTMPAMPMPTNRPVVKEGQGTYLGEAVFTMAGAWRATFSLTLPDGGRKSLAFDIPQVLLK